MPLPLPSAGFRSFFPNGRLPLRGILLALLAADLGFLTLLIAIVTAAALLRLASPLAGGQTAAFATFAVHYGRFLLSNSGPPQ